MFYLQFYNFFGLHCVVHHAHSVPQNHVAAGYAVDISAEVFVGGEDYFLVLGQGIDKFFGVTRSAYQIGQGFNLRRAVDVGNNHVVGVLGFELGKILGLARFGQRAACLHVGQNHFFRRVEDFGGLGHEMNAAENNYVAVHIQGFLGKGQTIAHIVR